MAQLFIFLAFLKRDWYVYSQRLKRYFLNYMIIYPIIYALCFAYLLPYVGMAGEVKLPINVIVAGLILYSLFPLAWHINIDLLFDLEQDRFTDYQITVLAPHLFLIEKVLFTSLFIFGLTAPIYPALIFILYRYFDFAAIQWSNMFLLLYVGSLFCAVLSIFLNTIISDSRHLRNVWRRCNYPMLMLGGFLTPWKIMATFSPLLGAVVLLNPMLWITEGLRQAMIGGSEFLPYSTALIALLFYSLVLMLASFYFFKKKMDHI